MTGLESRWLEGARALMLLGLILWGAAGCHPTGVGGTATPVSVLATVDGIPIDAVDVEEALAPQISRLEEQIYALKRRKLDEIVEERLLAQEAARRGMSVQRLLAEEVASRVPLVSDEDVRRAYEQQPTALDGERADTLLHLRSILQNERLNARRRQFVDSLRSKARVVAYLPPPIVRVEIPGGGAAWRGATDAPVTIVEFTDVHCPFCGRVRPTIDEILARYGDTVKHVVRDFPVDRLHPAARAAHEAARCAGDQTRFWEFRALAFDRAPRAGPEDLKGFAREVGLDLPRFEHCIAAGTYRMAVQQDIDEGRRLGVTGTPTFFINGRYVAGAQPLQAYARLIDEELARVGQRHN